MFPKAGKAVKEIVNISSGDRLLNRSERNKQGKIQGWESGKTSSKVYGRKTTRQKNLKKLFTCEIGVTTS